MKVFSACFPSRISILPPINWPLITDYSSLTLLLCQWYFCSIGRFKKCMKKYTSKDLSTILKGFWSISYFYRSFAGALLNISSLSSFYSAFLNIWDDLLVLVILYVFQDVCKQDLINITSNYKILKILSSYLMITIDSNIIFRNHVTFNFILKYHITISLRQFTKIFKQFRTYLEQRKTSKLASLFCLSHWMNQSNYEKLFLDIALINGNYLRNSK